MNYTPGPWKCDFAHHHATHKESGAAQRVYAVVKCTCKPKHDFAVRYVPYNDDDANLIAGTPALYEALRNLVNNLPESEIEIAREAWGNTNTRIVSEAREAARQALAVVQQEVNDDH
ncbi:MAG: hypothetical protein ACYSW6_10235 [Planctomycetota bacterium]|jgi:hypothetical protein